MPTARNSIPAWLSALHMSFSMQACSARVGGLISGRPVYSGHWAFSSKIQQKICPLGLMHIAFGLEQASWKCCRSRPPTMISFSYFNSCRSLFPASGCQQHLRRCSSARGRAAQRGISGALQCSSCSGSCCCSRDNSSFAGCDPHCCRSACCFQCNCYCGVRGDQLWIQQSMLKSQRQSRFQGPALAYVVVGCS